MTTIAQAYETRPIRFLDLWEIGGWKMKAYGIAYASEQPGRPLIDAARRLTAERLSTSAEGTRHHGVSASWAYTRGRPATSSS
jgi:hypothetical protein